MPIPLQQPPEANPQETSAPRLTLVPGTPRVNLARASVRWGAHIFDLTLLSGFSFYGSQFLSYLFLSVHLPALKGFGRPGVRLAEESLVYGQNRIFLAAFLFSSFLYFLLLPAFSGRTFGLGLMGCRIVNHKGGIPSLKACSVRYAIWLLHVSCAGLLLFSGVRRGVFLQDRMSSTRIVHE
jgi:uncharacterized RDD family membrane protein YckC